MWLIDTTKEILLDREIASEILLHILLQRYIYLDTTFNDILNVPNTLSLKSEPLFRTL